MSSPAYKHEQHYICDDARYYGPNHGNEWSVFVRNGLFEASEGWGRSQGSINPNRIVVGAYRKDLFE